MPRKIKGVLKPRKQTEGDCVATLKLAKKRLLADCPFYGIKHKYDDLPLDPFKEFLEEKISHNQSCLMIGICNRELNFLQENYDAIKTLRQEIADDDPDPATATGILVQELYTQAAESKDYKYSFFSNALQQFPWLDDTDCKLLKTPHPTVPSEITSYEVTSQLMKFYLDRRVRSGTVGKELRHTHWGPYPDGKPIRPKCVPELGVIKHYSRRNALDSRMELIKAGNRIEKLMVPFMKTMQEAIEKKRPELKKACVCDTTLDCMHIPDLPHPKRKHTVTGTPIPSDSSSSSLPISCCVSHSGLLRPKSCPDDLKHERKPLRKKVLPKVDSDSSVEHILKPPRDAVDFQNKLSLFERAFFLYKAPLLPVAPEVQKERLLNEYLFQYYTTLKKFTRYKENRYKAVMKLLAVTEIMRYPSHLLIKIIPMIKKHPHIFNGLPSFMESEKVSVSQQHCSFFCSVNCKTKRQCVNE